MLSRKEGVKEGTNKERKVITKGNEGLRGDDYGKTLLVR